MDFKHSIYFGILGGLDLERWQSLWREENRYWAAGEEPVVTFHSGAYLKETQLLQWEGWNFLLHKVGWQRTFMHFPESQPLFFKFNEFLNDKCNILLKILESVGRQVLIELSHKHCAGHLPGLIRFP